MKYILIILISFSSFIFAENISDTTGFPEILDGRVKTLHPKIYAGILSIGNNKSHLEELQDLNIEKFDLVVNNLYPFEEIANDKNSELQDVLRETRQTASQECLVQGSSLCQKEFQFCVTSRMFLSMMLLVMLRHNLKRNLCCCILT